MIPVLITDFLNSSTIEFNNIVCGNLLSRISNLKTVAFLKIL